MNLGLASLALACAAATPALAYDGCLGAEVRACLAAIQPHLTQPDFQAAQLDVERYLGGDIAGHRTAQGVVSVPYRSSFAGAYDSPQLVVLNYAPTLAITQVEITLRPGADNAETDDDYRATRMYEAALFALGSRPDCPALAEAHDFYLFFHTQVRPKLREVKAERGAAGFTPVTGYTGETGWVALCGRKMRFTVSSAEWGAVQGNMDRKYSVHGATLAFR
ncbi:hypothetical protein GGD83_000146 [Rhodoblastus sphagnicola]|nr:hypothetical protein [Rhodoblastus sphagnicola]MBB4196375.1 hypothetical protein [Rhodoblastus sphagnicola]